MPKFRMRPVEVEAEPYRAGLEDEWAHLWRHGVLVGRYPSREAADACADKVSPGFFGTSVPVIVSANRRTVVGPGDWIVTRADGERSVLPAHLFRAGYVACEPEAGSLEPACTLRIEQR